MGELAGCEQSREGCVPCDLLFVGHLIKQVEGFIEFALSGKLGDFLCLEDCGGDSRLVFERGEVHFGEGFWLGN